LKGEEATPDALATFLHSYRSTPCSSSPNKKTPAENFLGRKIRTTLDLMLPSTHDKTTNRNVKMENQFNQHHGARSRQFNVNDAVFVKDYRSAKQTWTPGTILRRLGNVTYLVSCCNLTWTRHANQLRSRDNITPIHQLLDIFDLPMPAKPMRQPSDAAPPASTPPPIPAATIPPSTPPTSTSTPSTTTTVPPVSRPSRPSRLRQPTVRLNMDPRQKTYRAVKYVSLT
jgi:hypothetical protein